MPDLLERLKAALAGRYEIERELGRGGMATVFLARDLKHPRKVAIKVLKPELAAAVGSDSFLPEIETNASNAGADKDKQTDGDSQDFSLHSSAPRGWHGQALLAHALRLLLIVHGQTSWPMPPVEFTSLLIRQ